MFPADCFHNILQYTDSHRTLVATYLTCRDFANWYEMRQDIKITYQSVRCEFLHKHANGKFICNVKDISLEFVQLHPNIVWSWSALSQQASFEDFVKYPNFSWNISIIMPQIPIEYILANPNINWNYWKIWNVQGLTYESIKYIIKMNLYHRVIHKIQLLNLDLTWEQMIELFPTCTQAISMHKNTTLDIIENSPDFNWDWGYISTNPNLTWEFILRYPEKRWNLYEISRQPFVNIDLIKKYPNHRWDVKTIRCNGNITMQQILDDPELVTIPGLVDNFL